ncbi:hypothetical protein JL720_12923 [Aureococcus anophagefferens]|nr:hypothetical protein JL720_12923 [Aureococcus anophagefferens]
MGSMLALNMCEHTGEKIAGYELDAAKGAAAKAKAEAEGFGGVFEAFSDVAAFVGALKAPRRIVLSCPRASPSSVPRRCGRCWRRRRVMDGGNEWFENTERRAAAYAEAGIHYLGCGVSGGAEGAPRPSLMSFLVEITGGILKKLDGDGAAVDRVLDSCGSKGTGKWTVKEAAEQGVPAGTIAAALEARYLSSLKATRASAQRDCFGGHTYKRRDREGTCTTDWLH